MVLQIYDYTLLTGVILCLAFLSFELLVLLKPTVLAASLGSIKFLAIFGILLFTTALVGGSALTGYITEESIGSNINLVAQKFQDNNIKTENLKTTLSGIKESISQENYSPERENLLAQIDDLEYKLRSQLDNNEELEDDLYSLKKELRDLYTILPGAHY
ncbi:hypothetical protein J4437_01660 [Candidatus Woesearchaeota archaeon]|nr:hypothetical protein [Candidatus Woesearchaeota archaeon]